MTIAKRLSRRTLMALGGVALAAASWTASAQAEPKVTVITPYMAQP